MAEQVEQIAKRIKELREANEMSIEWAAKALGVTVDELKCLESGEEDIPVGFLYMAAKKYGVELSSLLTGEDPQQKTFQLVRSGKGVEVLRRSHYQYQSLCSDFAHKKLEPMLVVVPVHQEGDELAFNSHPGQEFHYLLKGRLKVVIGEDEIIMDEGDSLIFDSENPHALQAMDNNEAKFLVVLV